MTGADLMPGPRSGVVRGYGYSACRLIAQYDNRVQGFLPKNAPGAERYVIATLEEGGKGSAINRKTAGMAYFNADSLRLAALRKSLFNQYKWSRRRRLTIDQNSAS